MLRFGIVTVFVVELLAKIKVIVSEYSESSVYSGHTIIIELSKKLVIVSVSKGGVGKSNKTFFVHPENEILLDGAGVME